MLYSFHFLSLQNARIHFSKLLLFLVVDKLFAKGNFVNLHYDFDIRILIPNPNKRKSVKASAKLLIFSDKDESVDHEAKNLLGHHEWELQCSG